MIWALFVAFAQVTGEGQQGWQPNPELVKVLSLPRIAQRLAFGGH